MRNRYVLLADFVVFALAVCAAFGFRFDWYFFQARPEFQPYVIAAPIVKVVVFYLFGMYGRFWRYATVDDLVALLLASSVASVAMAIYVSAGIFLFGFISEFSRSDPGRRLGSVHRRRGRDSPFHPRHQRLHERQAAVGRPDPGKRVLVAGAGAAGAIVVREMAAESQR